MREMKAFSMIELVFVIIILGIIASIALPRFSITKSDAQYTAIIADIQTTINTIQQHFITQDIALAQLNGNFIMQHANLSKTRWIASGNGVRLAKNGAVDTANNCVLIDFNQNNLVVRIENLQTPLCKKLLKTYPQPIVIPLESNTIKI